MLDWKIFAILAPLFYAIFGSLSKLLPKDNPIFLVNAYAYLFGSILMIIIHLIFTQNKSLVLNSKSIILSLAIGSMLAMGTFSVIKAYSLNAPQSTFSIIAYVVLILLGIFFGVIFFRERLTLPVILGAFLSLAGVLIIIFAKK